MRILVDKGAKVNLAYNVSSWWGGSNRTELRWQAPATGPKPSGYVVLVRETSAPQWQQRFPVSGLTADFPISKDNFIFGVVSVDAAGHESVAVLPVVGR